MSKRVRDGFILVYCVILLACPVLAADTPLAIVPAQTSVIVRLKNPRGVIEKIAKIAERWESAASPPPAGGAPVESVWGAEVREQLLKAIGEISGNPAQTGVDLEGEFWLFAPDMTSKVGCAIPVTNLGEMQAALGADVPLVPFDNWALYGSDAETIERIKECLAGKGKLLTGRLDAESRAVFEHGDIAALLNVRQLMTEHSEFKTEARSVLSETFADTKEIFEALLGTSPLRKALDALFNQLIEGLVQALQDSECIAVSLSFDEGEIRFENYARVNPGSPTARLLNANPPSEMAALSALPSSSELYFGFQGNIKTLAAWYAEFLTREKLDADDAWYAKFFDSFTGDPKTLQAEKQIRRGYQALELGALVGALPMKPVEEGLFRIVTITEADDPRQVRELNRQWSRLPAELPGPKARPRSFTPDAEKYGSQPADVAVSPFPIMNDDIQKDAGLVAKWLFGPDQFTARMVYLDRRVVQVIGGSKIGMAAIVRRATDAGWSEQEPCVVKLRKKLGDKLNFIVMFDPAGITRAVMRTSQAVTEELLKKGEEQAAGAREAMQQGKAAVKQIDELEAARSLIGFSVALKPQGIRVTTIVPLDAVETCIKSITVFAAAAEFEAKPADMPAEEEQDRSDENGE